jgi:serine/threonine protein kinase
MIGQTIGSYRITAKLGAGGMGEVYRATDRRLGREVAIKFSAERFSERFEREARAIAALNHSNICHLYDVGPNYLVMELVEGETLHGPCRSRRLSTTPSKSRMRWKRRTRRASHTAT